MESNRHIVLATSTILLLVAIGTLGCTQVISTPGGEEVDGGVASNTQPDGGEPRDPPPCQLASCESGMAATCRGERISLDCVAFGGACASFVDTEDTAFEWCDCGGLAEGKGRCLDRSNAVICDSGMGAPALCPAGTYCYDTEETAEGIACACDGQADGTCPDAACTNDPDCQGGCTAECGSRECGPDPACGQSCGSCGFGQTCDGGRCICEPICSGRECGPDGCGGQCGSCGDLETCTSNGACVTVSCNPGQYRCNGPILEGCTDGSWVFFAHCSQGCDNSACLGPPACGEGEARCVGLTAQRCENGQWVRREDCSQLCDNGECKSAPTVEPCPIEKQDLRVSMPYVSLEPPTVVKVSGSCYRQSGGQVSEGYTSASALNALEDRTSSVKIDHLSILYFIQYKIGQRQLSQSELGTLASKTGIPLDVLGKATQEMIATDMDATPTLVDYALPEGVSVQVFLPTSTDQDGFIRFDAMQEDEAKLQQVLARLTSGITIKARLRPFIGYGGYDYTLRLTTGPTKVQVLAIQP